MVILWEGLPLVGEQLPEAAERMVHDTAEYMIKVLPRIILLPQISDSWG